MRAKLLLPICLVISAIVHVVLLTAVAVPRQRVTHGQIMTVDLVTPDEVPESARGTPQPDMAPSPMGQAQEPAAQSQQTAVAKRGAAIASTNEPPPRDVRQPASQQRTQTVQQVQPPQLQPPSQQFPQPQQQVAIPVPDPQNPSTQCWAGKPGGTGRAAFRIVEFAGTGRGRGVRRGSRHQGEADPR